MRLGFLTLGMFIAATAAVQVLGTQQASSPAETSAFLTSLESCTAGKVQTPHPLMASFIVEHTITGEENGKCAYRQTMPGKMTMICALTPSGRKALATDMKAMISGGSLRGGTSAAQPEWFKECEIELPSGSRIPAAPAK